VLFILFVLLFFTGKIRETVPQVENQPVASEPLPFYPCDPTKEKCV
jgi:hypothetical protein